jgi:glycosyltransferase involved in cell wall biosynthesis
MARARAVLFPIQWEEPFGLVMAEANACGTPVLAFPRGAAPEVVADGETGFLCADLDAMVAAVDRVAEIDPHACRARVEKMFSAQAMTSGYEELYARALKS